MTTPTDRPDQDKAPADPDRGASPWRDLQAYTATPRLGGLTLSPDGSILLVAVSAPNADHTAYRSSLWRVDPHGEQPARRVTRSVEGEAAAAFLPGGDLLFTSKRAVPAAGPEGEATEVETGGAETSGALWCLPADGGEAYVVARRDGGWTGIHTARNADLAVLSAPTHVGVADDEADAKKRADRRKRKIAAILHDGYPVRYWDSDLGPEATRLVAADLAARRSDGDRWAGEDGPRPLTGDVGRAVGEGLSLSDDGRRLVVEWRTPRPHGEIRSGLVSIDVPDGQRTTLAEDVEDDFGAPIVSPDGSTVCAVRGYAASAHTAPDQKLWLILGDEPGRVLAEDWDAWPDPIAFSPDGATVYVAVDEDGQGPLYAVDVATGARRRLTVPDGPGLTGPGAGTFGQAVLSPDGGALYAVRTSYADPGTVVAVATDGSGVRELRAVDYPELPGTVAEVETTAEDGSRVRGWLLLPSDTDRPAPLALWIHGGPLSSWNSWSWRWCPWLMVSRGYAVLLPDPALSTGYGRAYVQRGWGRWGAEPYTDLMSITDAVLARDDIDAERPVAMGGSFGGYMANWVAGHTDRFAGIVSHAGLWNLESFGPTTDAAWHWAKEMSPRMQQEHSPHRFADNITTPMLVIHGDKDYRVPIGEGLSLWWALCARHDGDPADLPHRFLYFPDENHWVLTPQHAQVWYETVLAFCEAVRSGGNFVRPESL